MAAQSTIREVLDLHRAQLKGVIESRGVNRVRRIYEEARAEVQGRLEELVRTNRGKTFQAQHYRFVLAQMNEALSEFSTRFRRHLEDSGGIAAELGTAHVVGEIQKLERRFTGVSPVIQAAQIGVVRRIQKGVAPSLLTRYAQSMTFYGRPTVEAIHRQLAHSMATNATVDEAVDRVAGTHGVFAAQRYRAERIVRTELSYSYGVTKQRTLEEIAARQMPDLQKKLIATFDTRTGDDSKELHGQVVRYDEPFAWKKPDGKIVHYMQPPNRPNDREIVISWRPGWKESAVTMPDPTDPPGPVDPEPPPPLPPAPRPPKEEPEPEPLPPDEEMAPPPVAAPPPIPEPPPVPKSPWEEANERLEKLQRGEDGRIDAANFGLKFDDEFGDRDVDWLRRRLLELRNDAAAMKDVPQIGMGSISDISPVQKVKIKDLITTDRSVDPKAIRYHLEHKVEEGFREDGGRELGDKPIVYKEGEKFYLWDGHSRVAAASLMGEEEIEARVVDIGPEATGKHLEPAPANIPEGIGGDRQSWAPRGRKTEQILKDNFEAVQKISDTFRGLVGAKEESGGVNGIAYASRGKRGAIAWYHPETKEITLTKHIAERLVGAMARGEATYEEANSFEVLLHEVMHGASNKNYLYQGAGRAMEEATTEISAQHYAKQLLQAMRVKDVSGIAEKPLFEWRDGEVRSARGTSYMHWCQQFARMASFAEGLGERAAPEMHSRAAVHWAMKVKAQGAKRFEILAEKMLDGRLDRGHPEYQWTVSKLTTSLEIFSLKPDQGIDMLKRDIAAAMPRDAAKKT